MVVEFPGRIVAGAQSLVEAGTVLAAFSEEHVERLTGLTRKQLRYWDRTGFFTPAFADRDRRLPYSRVYSFKDVVALRTISALRFQFNVPLQELRKVREKLNDLSNDLWVKTQLYAYNKRVIFHNKEAGALQEVVSGQYLVHRRIQGIQAWARMQGRFPAFSLDQSEPGPAAG